MDLCGIPTLLINLASEQDRRREASQLLNRLEIQWKRIPGVPRGPRIGHAAATLAALSQSQLVDGPVLVVEDDIGLMEEAPLEFSIPLEADAIYLGHSCWGHGDADDGQPVMRGFRWEAAPQPDVVRLYNMLSTHAVVYVSERYKQFAIDQCVESIRWDHHLDMRLSRRFERFNIFATRRPVFFQQGSNESVTRLSICDD